MHSPHLGLGSYVLVLGGQTIYINLEFFCVGHSFHSFSSFNHLYQYGLKHFYALVYNLVLFYFVAQIVLALAIGNLSVGSCVSSKWCIFVVVVLVLFFGFVLCFFFKHFLSLQDTTG